MYELLLRMASRIFLSLRGENRLIKLNLQLVTLGKHKISIKVETKELTISIFNFKLLTISKLKFSNS